MRGKEQDCDSVFLWLEIGDFFLLAILPDLFHFSPVLSYQFLFDVFFCLLLFTIEITNVMIFWDGFLFKKHQASVVWIPSFALKRYRQMSIMQYLLLMWVWSLIVYGCLTLVDAALTASEKTALQNLYTSTGGGSTWPITWNTGIDPCGGNW